jgi:hypothetical protein
MKKNKNSTTIQKKNFSKNFDEDMKNDEVN